MEDGGVSDTCVKHSFETAAGVCRQCEHSYCAECLIFAFGPDAPPYCVTCALNAAGVRHQGATPKPKTRRRGLFRRRAVEEAAPVEEATFDDIQIELPERATAGGADRAVVRREIDPEVLAMVEEAERAERAEAAEIQAVSPALALAERLRSQDGDPLADWASAIEERPHRRDGNTEPAPWPEDAPPADPWPEPPAGRAF